MGRRIVAGLAAAGVLVLGAVACAHFFGSGDADLPPVSLASGEDGGERNPTPGLPWFVNVTAASRIAFRHYNCATDKQYIQESLGSGLGWIDYNNDGWPDLFIVQDGPSRPSAAHGPLPSNKLYRNNGDGTFTDVTEEVGLTRSGFGLGCAVGDYDNDGWDDLVVTYMGGIVLYHNEPDSKGGRRLVDVTSKAGLNNNPHLATSCAWGDVDGDGLLDLYVCNYVEVDFDHYPECTDAETGQRILCAPTYFTNVPHRLYHNNGDGSFTDISQSSGIAAVTPAPGLAVLITDLDGDGRPDIYVANDLKASYLFHNQGPVRSRSQAAIHFEETAALSGCALDNAGLPLAGMGIDAGDLDGSGRPSLFVTNFQQRPNMLYLNRGGLHFEDASYASGLGAPSLSRLKFGTVFLDATLQGHLDIAVANGHVQPHSLRHGGAPVQQEAQYFLGDGHGRFRDVSAQAGPYFSERYVGRGLAWADYDNDGRPDLAFSHLGGPIALLHNETETKHNWLTLELVGDGKRSNRNAFGARVEIYAGGQRQVRFINGGGSYLSASERRVVAGLGDSTRAERVLVTWPSGRKQEYRDLEARRWYRLHEGQEHARIITPRKPI
jgi:hypothetical protein